MGAGPLVVLDNASLHWVKWIGKATGERYLAVDFEAQPDLAAVAEASGAHAERIEAPGTSTALGRARRPRRPSRPCSSARSTPGTTRKASSSSTARCGGWTSAGGEECDMTWIQTGSSVCFKPYTLQEALRGGLPRRASRRGDRGGQGIPRTPRPRPARASRDCRDASLLDRHRSRCVSMSGHAPLHTSLGLDRLR